MDGISDLDRVRQRHPGRENAALVTLLTDQLIQELELQPPVDLELLASARGIAAIELVDIPWAGCLLPHPGGLRIQLRVGDSSGRRRFTGCHEVAHTLMSGFATISYRCTPGDSDPSHGYVDQDVERLCDLAASQLLLPQPYFGTDLRGQPFGWDGLQLLAERYEASLEAVARRAVAVSDRPTLFLALKPAASHTDPKPRLRVASQARSGDWPFIPTNKSVPAEHPLQDALAGELVDGPADLLGLTATGRPAPVQLSARLFPLRGPEGDQIIMRVLAIASPQLTTSSPGDPERDRP
jgi:hypothetical protein